MEFTLREAEKVWLISDTHFDHTNIIKYCNRPFNTVEGMNKVLLHNWNNTIAPDDLVFFLGDMAFGRGSRKPWWWVARLNGKIVWVKGSHDRGVHTTSVMPNVLRVMRSEVIICGGTRFLLVHDVFDAAGWDGWVIHGHSHGNQPYLDAVRRRVSVSVEVIGYKPVSLAKIVRSCIMGEVKAGRIKKRSAAVRGTLTLRTRTKRKRNSVKPSVVSLRERMK